MKPAKLIQICLNETYSKVWIRRHLSDVSNQDGMEQGAALLPIPFNFVLKYAFQRVQVNQDDLKLNGIHQFLVYADDNTLGGNIHTTMKNKETLLVDSRETGLELNIEKTASL
jgi:hypothetical protein